jgi:putative ABC transport system substrate-binding protein
MTILSRRNLFQTSARLAGLGSIGAGMAILGGCQLISTPAAAPITVRRIGYLGAATRVVDQPFIDAFVDQLQQLGWIQGENLRIEFRLAEGHSELLPELAAELVRLPVEVILGAGALGVKAALQQTDTIPIVMAQGPDPTFSAANGSVQNLARPGRNVTGNIANGAAWMIKQVELLHTVLPALVRLAVLADRSTPNYTDLMPPAAHTAQTLGMQVLDLDVRRSEDVDAALESAGAWGAEASLVISTGTYSAGVYPHVSQLAAQLHMPVMYGAGYVVSDYGGRMSFNSNFPAAWRQGAVYVDKILRGANPADLPVQEPTQFDFIVNVKAAQALSITFPPDAAAQVTQWVQ